MKILICFALCALIASTSAFSFNPVHDLHSALTLFNMEELLSIEGKVKLTSSFTFTAGSDNDFEQGFHSSSEIYEDFFIDGTYYLIVTDLENQTTVESGSFNRILPIDRVDGSGEACMSGSGIFTLESGESYQSGSFSVQTISNITFRYQSDVMAVFGVNEINLGGNISGGNITGSGSMTQTSWQPTSDTQVLNKTQTEIDFTWAASSVNSIPTSIHYSGESTVDLTTLKKQNYTLVLAVDYSCEINSDDGEYTISGTQDFVSYQHGYPRFFNTSSVNETGSAYSTIYDIIGFNSLGAQLYCLEEGLGCVEA